MSAIPAHIAALMAKANVAKTDEMALGGSSVPRISTKKSRFTAKVGADETRLGEEIYVVILGISPSGPMLAKTFYASGYTEGSNDAPDCSSTNGLVPDSFVQNPVSKVCATCPKNQWGSAVSQAGKKAKACSESKQLHVVLAEDALKENPTVYLLTVTVNTFKNFTEFGNSLRSQGITSPCFVMTKVSFDEEASVPKLEFEMSGFLDEAPMLALLPIAEEKPWEQAMQTALPAPEPAEAPKQVTSQVPATSGQTIDQALDTW